MILFIYGEDTFRSRRYLGEQIARFKEIRDPQGYNVVSLDALQEKDGSRLMSETLSAPFLAEKRMVIIENLLASKLEDSMEQFIKRIQENTLPESNIVVFWESAGEPKAKLKKELFALLQKEKYATDFLPLDDRKREAWIMEEIKKQNTKIERDAVLFLSVHTRGDMWRIHAVLDQCVAYASGAPITKEIVTLFLATSEDDSIFNLVDAIVAGFHKKALAMIAEQYRQGKEPQYIFAMIARQYRILLTLRSWLDSHGGATSDQSARELGINPYVVKKTWPLVKNMNTAQLKSAHKLLLAFDKQSKSGLDPDVLLDVLALRLQSKAL